ncbi:LptA/OstA family protein [Azorhizobium doebereinerae]|uniref:LptA/OstA family protein n=1 Tax=Azorhizobium doebereinerae TaxID=281091 RepID=UPI00041A967D|nr:LptA/OstA family protein [Azorhizobium doebereinerae]
MNPLSFGLTAAALLVVLSTPVLAQQPQQPAGPPNALQGFARNRDEPIRINSNTLEVRDKEKQAVFAGNVVVTQGDTTLRSPQLLVFYDGDVAAGVQGTAPTESSKIRKIEATGGVVVQTKDQTATGDTGVFEMKTNTVTMNGNPVVLTQGPNVIRGKRLVVDLTSGVSKFEGGRVESLIVPGSMKQDQPGQPGQPKR